MLHSSKIGNKKMFTVNKLHPLFKDVNQIVRKYLGIDVIIDNILRGLGEPTKIYLTGELAEGRNCDLVDIILIGKINKNYLTDVIEKTEKIIERKIRYIAYTEEEFSKRSQNKKQIIWKSYPEYDFNKKSVLFKNQKTIKEILSTYILPEIKDSSIIVKKRQKIYLNKKQE